MSLTQLPAGAELERLLEEVEAAQYRSFFDVLTPQVRAEFGLSIEGSGASLRLTARGYDHPMFNRVMGVGLEGDRPPAEAAPGVLAEAAAHYREAGVRRWMLQLLPQADSEAFRAEAARLGAIRLRGWTKHLAPLPLVPDETSRNPVSGLRVLRIDEAVRAGLGDAVPLARRWASIVCENFDLPDGFRPWLSGLHGHPGWHLYLAWVGNTLVGTGGLHLNPTEEGTFGELTFGSTLPQYRGQGAQSALILRRAADAREFGCRWVTSETDEHMPDRPNPSHRNLARLGLHPRWVRANWGPPKPVG